MKRLLLCFALFVASFSAHAIGGADTGPYIVQYGTNAERLALTSVKPLTEFKETDTGNYYKWYGSWLLIPQSGSSSVTATQSGTWTVQPGNTANTTPWLVTPSQSTGTNLHTVTDSGSLTAATQSGTWTVQPGNTANTTAWKVDNSAVTQPVTAAKGTFTDRSGTITTGGTAQTLASSNATRKYLIIENVSAGDIWINFTTAAVQGQPSIKLVPNSSYVMEAAFVSTEAVSVIAATTGQAFTAKEGN